MKRFLYSLLVVLVVLIGLTFSYKNSQDVLIQYYFGIRLMVKLPLLLLLTFALGLLVGYLLTMFGTLDAKRKLFRANRQLRALQKNENATTD